MSILDLFYCGLEQLLNTQNHFCTSRKCERVTSTIEPRADLRLAFKTALFGLNFAAKHNDRPIHYVTKLATEQRTYPKASIRRQSDTYAKAIIGVCTSLELS